MCVSECTSSVGRGGDFEDKDLEVSVLLVMLSPC